jgi:pyruvate/2-oxoglutarate dehydrogenase complex dihydrolipoamide dehydrogenase (E3) component
VTDFDYDVIVLGCGTAGSKAAATAAKAGAKVLAVDGAEELGGLCILRGCMPTKTLLETTHRLHDIRDAARFGIRVGEPQVDFPAMMERMRQLVARFQRAKIKGIEGGGYELRRAWARFTGPQQVELTPPDGGPTETLSAKAFVIGTGSRVREFPCEVPEGVQVLTSDHMFELTELPKRTAVVGGGAVGLEFAQWLGRLGSEVLLSVRSPLLHRTDPEMGRELGAALAEDMEVCVPSTIDRVERLDDGAARLHMTCAEGPRAHDVDLMVLNATGRVPNVEGLNLEAVGLDPADLGLTEGFQSKVQHVFVAGDTTGDRAILHEANYEGALAGANAAAVARGEEATAVYDRRTPPMDVIFTDPPVANVGRTPLQLERDGTPYEVATKRFPQQGRGIVMGAEHGLLRLVAEPGGGKVLGCQVFGPRADDLAHVPAAVIRLGGTVRDMQGIPWYHPTLSEAFIEVCRALAPA